MQDEPQTQQIDLPPGIPLGQRPVILPNSVEGDMVHLVCSAVLDWMIEHGDERLVKKAKKIRRNWSKEQAWLIAWCNHSHFFELVANATANPEAFQEMKKLVPSEGESVDRVITMVEMALEKIEAKKRGEAIQKKKKPKVVQLNQYKRQHSLIGVKPLKVPR